MTHAPHNQNIMDGLPVATDARSLVNYGQVATNFMGKMGNPVAGGLEYLSAGMDRDESIKQATEITGESTSSLKAGSPAFKKYVKELGGLEEERMSGFAVGIIGAGIATSLVGMIFGLPGGILGFVVGTGVAIGGGMVANMVKEHFWPSQANEFLTFASNLQSMGQEQRMIPEAAFVALTMNLSDGPEKRQILHSMPRQFKIKRARDMLAMLGDPEGREVLRRAMIEHDATLRAANCAMSQAPSATICEHLAQAVNAGQVAGVDLLNTEKTSMLGTMIAAHETQSMMMQQQAAAQQHINPNVALPEMGRQQQRHGF